MEHGNIFIDIEQKTENYIQTEWAIESRIDIKSFHIIYSNTEFSNSQV